MKPIKFDLPIDGVKVTTVDQLRNHFTTEIVDHFRAGTLAHWLRTRRDSEAKLVAVEELSEDYDDQPRDYDDRRLLMALCKTFQIDADEHSVEVALADATGVPGSAIGSKRITDGGASGVLVAGGECRWSLDVPAIACVKIEVDASTNMLVALEDERGLQIATNDALGGEISLHLKVILSKGSYYVRLRNFDGKSASDYTLRVSQAQECSISSREMGSDRKVYLKDLMTERSMIKRATKNNVLYEIAGTLAPHEADLWIIDMLGQTADVRTEGDLDTFGYLLDSIGRILEQDDNAGSQKNFRLSSPHKLHGKFAILVKGFSGNHAGDYRLVVKYKKVNQERKQAIGAAYAFPHILKKRSFGARIPGDLVGKIFSAREEHSRTHNIINTGFNVVLVGRGTIDLHNIPQGELVFGWPKREN